MTQALALSRSLSRRGHELVGVVVGRNSNRALPEFFELAFPTPITSLPSPGFVFRQEKSVDLPATLWQALTRVGRYRESLAALGRVVAETRPDLVFNFFEPLTGLHQLVRPLPVPVVSVAHQFMAQHPGYAPLPGRRAEQLGLRLFVGLVGFRSWKLALSLSPAPDMDERRLVASPPILREELFSLEPTSGGYYLVYILNQGYAEEIRAWHRGHPDVELHCFYDRKDAPEVDVVAPNLTFHRLDGDRFLRMMAGCRAVVCTAGFESVCEAAWLGKPVFLVPVGNHIEQMTNAADAVRAGMGITDRAFRLDRLQELPARLNNARFREWVARADDALDRVLTHAIESRRRGATRPGATVFPAGTSAPPPRPRPSR